MTVLAALLQGAVDRVAGGGSRRLLQPALLQGRRRAGASRASREIALYEFEVDAPGARCASCSASISTWRASRRRRRRTRSPARDRPARRRRAGAGAGAARDRGLLRCRREGRAVARAPAACRTSSSRSCPGRGCGCRAWRSTRPSRWRRARATRDEPWTDRLEKLRRTWRLKPGQPFRQADWSGAKNASTRRAARRRLSDGDLAVDPRPASTRPSGPRRSTRPVAPGPLFRLGPIRVEGIHRYDELAVRRLATFAPGDVYSEKLLLDYQERLDQDRPVRGRHRSSSTRAGRPRRRR